MPHSLVAVPVMSYQLTVPLEEQERLLKYITNSYIKLSTERLAGRGRQYQ